MNRLFRPHRKRKREAEGHEHLDQSEHIEFRAHGRHTSRFYACVEGGGQAIAIGWRRGVLIGASDGPKDGRAPKY